MFNIVLTLLLIGCPYFQCLQSGPELKLTSKLKDAYDQIINVNSIRDNGWEAQLIFNPEMSIESFIESRMGLEESVEGDNKKYFRSMTDENIDFEIEDLPESYDVRAKYPRCSSISSVKDQSNCGSCWAVAGASMLSDRFCIKSQSKISVNLSANYFTACSLENYGCRGGLFHRAYDFLQKEGLVTGGDFESDEGCQPYEIRPCGYEGAYPCPIPSSLTPKCRKRTCINEYYRKQQEEKTYKARRAYIMPKNETEIRKEIYLHGPVTAGLKVYLDFIFYKKGVYQKTSNRLVGLHAVRIIGWGVENNVPYWLVANSWSRRWGENGTFKIVRGKNECNFEEEVWAVEPLIDSV